MLKPPKNIRQLFDAIGASPETLSLETFIRQFDWSDALVQNVYYTFLNRLPESESVVRNYAVVDRAQHALETIGGGEFQGRIVELVLKAYPEKQRLIHVHIPKTAGVDFREKLVDHLPYVHLNHSLPETTTAERLLAHLAETSRRAKVENQILATGHIPLAWYVDKDLRRPDDRLFAVVRVPRESLISLINYYLRRIQEDPDCEFPDTRTYANFLGVDRFARDLDIQAQREIGKAMLMNESMIYPNLPKQMLGRGDYDSAIELMICTNIEIVPIEAYKAWLLEQWGIDSSTRANESPKVLDLEHLDMKQLRRISSICEDDVWLHQRMMSVWRPTGRTHIFGADLLRK